MGYIMAALRGIGVGIAGAIVGAALPFVLGLESTPADLAMKLGLAGFALGAIFRVLQYNRLKT